MTVDGQIFSTLAAIQWVLILAFGGINGRFMRILISGKKKVLAIGVYMLGTLIFCMMCTSIILETDLTNKISIPLTRAGDYIIPAIVVISAAIFSGFVLIANLNKSANAYFNEHPAVYFVISLLLSMALSVVLYMLSNHIGNITFCIMFVMLLATGFTIP